MKKDQRDQSEPFFLHKMGDHIIKVNYITDLSCFCVLFQEKKSYGVKTICIDPLSTRCCISHHEQLLSKVIIWNEIILVWNDTMS